MGPGIRYFSEAPALQQCVDADLSLKEVHHKLVKGQVMRSSAESFRKEYKMARAIPGLLCDHILEHIDEPSYFQYLLHSNLHKFLKNSTADGHRIEDEEDGPYVFMFLKDWAIAFIDIDFIDFRRRVDKDMFKLFVELGFCDIFDNEWIKEEIESNLEHYNAYPDGYEEERQEFKRLKEEMSCERDAYRRKYQLVKEYVPDILKLQEKYAEPITDTDYLMKALLILRAAGFNYKDQAYIYEDTQSPVTNYPVLLHVTTNTELADYIDHSSISEQQSAGPLLSGFVIEITSDGGIMCSINTLEAPIDACIYYINSFDMKDRRAKHQEEKQVIECKRILYAAKYDFAPVEPSGLWSYLRGNGKGEEQEAG